MNKFGEFFEGEWQNVLIKSVLVLVVFLILLRIIRKELRDDEPNPVDPKDQDEIIIQHDQTQNLEFLEQVCQGLVATEDGSDGDARDVEGNEITEAEADIIAINQYNALDKWQGFVAVRDVFAQVQVLNGRALQLVACKFGLRNQKNIFTWYYDKLCANTFTCGGFCWHSSKDPMPHSWVPDCPDCSWFPSFTSNQCSQIDAMKSIWKKAGINF